MKKSKRFVLDTNVLVSAALFSNSVPALAVKKAFNIGTVRWFQRNVWKSC